MFNTRGLVFRSALRSPTDPQHHDRGFIGQGGSAAQHPGPSSEKSTAMAANTTPFTGEQQADCGCFGTVMDAGTRLTGQTPIVTLKILNACMAGHPARLSRGCIERFDPAQFAALRPKTKTKAHA